MATARARVRGLSSEDVQTIREGVAAGRRPKVVFTEAAGQIAGQVGQVVSVTDPAESDEFLVVRFGRDELPFSPGDLQVAPKGAVARKASPPPAPPVAEPPARPEPEFVIDKPVVPASRRAAAAAAPPAAAASAADAPAAAGSPPASAAAPAAGRKAARPAKPKGPAGLTVTLAYADGEWTVAAAQGAKTLARPYVVKPSEALRMVSLVDVPGVQEAVAQILAAERGEAERAAERLRAELAEVEARLAELREAG
ncbi:hypothetical protein [Jidongwangia harbinensis]|uniref:hypothetical protein n=1 Tax=Jidongwangia harbinensis TaxID=2878561 RepID=UPI001CDA0F4C|nr:hypothetical protein [Jidongwangia harbinensis]MCA2214957.1 hypothetical protein [Jidongwangia harbinensis]